MLPSKTLATKADRETSGVEKYREWVAVLTCANAY